jgi:hypothetical protein
MARFMARSRDGGLLLPADEISLIQLTKPPVAIECVRNIRLESYVERLDCGSDHPNDSA